MAHLILTGATGLVGSAALVNLIARPASEVSKVTILSRREVPLIKDNPRFETVIQKDFGVYDAELLERLKGASGAIWAQGISITQVPREYVHHSSLDSCAFEHNPVQSLDADGSSEYIKITIDYPLAAAKSFASLSDNFKFIYVSGDGTAKTDPLDSG